MSGGRVVRDGDIIDGVFTVHCLDFNLSCTVESLSISKGFFLSICKFGAFLGQT